MSPNTEANFSGGSNRSSEEISVMEVEQRIGIIQLIYIYQLRNKKE